MRKTIPKSIRKQVYAKYNGHCAYCGCEIPEKGFNVDHLYCIRKNGGNVMTREKANEIANEFFKDMNPTFWNGSGDKPDTFNERIWECELSEYDDLNISLYYDGTDWVHCCEIVDKKGDTMTEMLTGYGIDSALNLVDTIMDLCMGYE